MGASHQGTYQRSAARLIRRHRRVLAGVASAASIAALGMALQPPAAATRGVVVAAAELPAGRSLAAADLSVAQVPVGVLAPGTSDDPGDFLGRTLAAPMARGEAIAQHRLTALPRWSVPTGTMPVPVRFADAGAAALLGAGQRVDVVATSGPGIDGAAPFTSAELVAQDVLVLAVMSADPSPGGVLSGSGTSQEQAPLVLLAADRTAALAIAGAQGRADLGYLLHLSPG
jgi:Flp pilus assembly protein CpaB